MRLQAPRPVRVGDRLLGGSSVLVCVPLLAPTRDMLIEQAGRLGAMRPDCIEWRADYLQGLTYWRSLPDQEHGRATLVYGGDSSYRRQGIAVLSWQHWE